MKRYLILLGTRPEAIKLCPLILELQRCRGVSLRVALTGQHRDMVHPVMHYFGVHADVEFDVMRQGQTLQGLTERLFSAMSHELSDSGFSPDAVLVHGDTTTAFVGGLCAFLAGVPVVHIEAGLRTGDIRSPFPEEFNRRAVDAMSAVHFAPTDMARRRLIAEGYPAERIFCVGNTATDALRLCLKGEFSHPLLDEVKGRRLMILTAHRREMSPDRRLAMLRAIRQEIEGRQDVLLLFPVHPSPAVRASAEQAFAGCSNARLTPPLPLPLMQRLLARAQLLLTDSGGLQEEATYLGLPTLVLREGTERPEGVAAGVLRTVGTQPQAVREAMAHLLDDQGERQRMAHPSDVYGDGYVSQRIAAVLQGLVQAGAL